GDVQFLGNFPTDIEFRQRARERCIFLQRHVVLARGLDNFFRDLAAALRHDARRTTAIDVVVECDGDRRARALVHARTSNSRAARAPVSPTGMPCKQTMRSISRPESRRMASSSPARADNASTMAGDSARNCTPMR